MDTDQDTVVDEVKQLLATHEDVVGEAGPRRQVEKLKAWLHEQREGADSAGRMSEKSAEWLADVRDQLMLAAEERQRLEDEGGPPASREQAQKTEDMLKMARRIDRILQTGVYH
jgi:hypothetical protein